MKKNNKKALQLGNAFKTLDPEDLPEIFKR